MKDKSIIFLTPNTYQLKTDLVNLSKSNKTPSTKKKKNFKPVRASLIFTKFNTGRRMTKVYSSIKK